MSPTPIQPPIEPPTRDDPDRQDALLRYVERFALALRGMGMPPMGARVFAYALAEDRDRYTATELVDALQVSPAAISGAVNYLVATGLLAREREPGTRSDLYVLNDQDPWPTMIERRLTSLREFVALFREGVDVVGPTSPGGRRLEGSAAFFEFLGEELPRLLAGWQRPSTTDHPHPP